MRQALLFVFSHRFLALARWDLHFIVMRLRNWVTHQPARIRAFLAARQPPLYLNLGSGPRGIDDGHWVNVDGYSGKNIHFLLDIGRPLPFPDAAFDGVFCEHVLEHFSREDGERIAREVLRCLRPGGAFRIVMPDAALILRLYLHDPQELTAWRGAEGDDVTAMEMVNSYFRQRYEHQFLYDWPTLEKMLRAAGFSDVVRTRYRESTNPALALDDAKYARESLYGEARK